LYGSGLALVGETHFQVHGKNGKEKVIFKAFSCRGTGETLLHTSRGIKK
jgi:hypothetical protein